LIFHRAKAEEWRVQRDGFRTFQANFAPNLPQFSASHSSPHAGTIPQPAYEEFQRGFLLPALLVLGATSISQGFCALRVNRA
jgi:hypothetical protein